MTLSLDWERLNAALKALHEQRDQDQATVARGIRVDQGTLSKARRGKFQRVSSRILLGLQRCYGVNPDWVRHGTGEMLLEAEPAPNGSGPPPAFAPAQRFTADLTDDETELVLMYRKASPALQWRILRGARAAVYPLEDHD